MSETPREVFKALLRRCLLDPDKALDESVEERTERAEWLARFDAACAKGFARLDADGVVRVLVDTSGGLAPKEWVPAIDAGAVDLVQALKAALLGPPSPNTARADFYQDARGEWRWRIKATNGRVIADSGEGYVERRDCEAGLALVGEALGGGDDADDSEIAELRRWKADQLAEREAMQGDVRELLLAVGLDPGPQPRSPHLVVVGDVLPRVRELAAQADGWIGVEERLPRAAGGAGDKDRERVEFYDITLGVSIGCLWHDGTWWNGALHVEPGEVTHWRPLPEPPK